MAKKKEEKIEETTPEVETVEETVETPPVNEWEEKYKIQQQ